MSQPVGQWDSKMGHSLTRALPGVFSSWAEHRVFLTLYPITSRLCAAPPSFLSSNPGYGTFLACQPSPMIASQTQTSACLAPICRGSAVHAAPRPAKNCGSSPSASCSRRPYKCRAAVTLKIWCGGEDSNLHGITTASPSSWRFSTLDLLVSIPYESARGDVAVPFLVPVGFENRPFRRYP